MPNCRWRSGRGRDCIKSSSDILDQCGRFAQCRDEEQGFFWTGQHNEYRACCFAKLFLLIASPVFFLLIFFFLAHQSILGSFRRIFTHIWWQITFSCKCNTGHSLLAGTAVHYYLSWIILLASSPTVISLPMITSLTLSYWYFLSLPGPFSYCCHAQACNEYFLNPMWQIIMFFLIANHIY